ncbi:hypothetical protein OHA91_38520 [Streptomyces erythrochromogenes]|uniref:Transposase IS701-like DDE domain-containing protein n=2 Tax=Streptomyces erythrochromogenes TaxID=285574 RepID=A0ABZ1QNK8_9ACTN|nr:hypothetical protein [Streptomyces erythrochromogenes]
MAEQACERCPDGVQRFMNQADWDADAVRDEVRSFTLEHLAADGGVLIMDDRVRQEGRLIRPPPTAAGNIGRALHFGCRRQVPTKGLLQSPSRRCLRAVLPPTTDTAPAQAFRGRLADRPGSLCHA